MPSCWNAAAWCTARIARACSTIPRLCIGSSRSRRTETFDQERSAMAELDQDKVVTTLNRILEQELAGVVRYTHYSFMVFGFGRIPIVSWLREQANEALLHAQ